MTIADMGLDELREFGYDVELCSSGWVAAHREYTPLGRDDTEAEAWERCREHLANESAAELRELGFDVGVTPWGWTASQEGDEFMDGGQRVFYANEAEAWQRIREHLTAATENNGEGEK